MVFSNGNGNGPDPQAEYARGLEDGAASVTEDGWDDGYNCGLRTAMEANYLHGLHEAKRTEGGTFAVRPADPSKMRPVEFVYKPWIVRGRGNEIVGEEDVGKSTFACYIAAGITKGTLPGAFELQPKNVLFLGSDEDDWNGITLPRLTAAGADLDRVHEFYAVKQDLVFNAEKHGSHLRRLLTPEYGLVVIEHVSDILPELRNPNEPMAIRRALRPLLRALASVEVAALWTRHVNKAEAKTFRQKAQGSSQFGAVARSSFLIAKHPRNDLARVAVLGKANYAKEKVSLSFTLAECVFAANDFLFSVGRVVDVEDESITMEEALGGRPRPPKPSAKDEMKPLILDALPGTKDQLASELGKSPENENFGTALKELRDAGEIEFQRVGSRGGWWVKTIGNPTTPPTENEPLFEDEEAGL